MIRLFAPAAIVLAAGAASAQVVVRTLPSAPRVVPPALAAPLLSAPSLETPSLTPFDARVLGVPGPGVTPAHIEAIKLVAESLDRPIVVHGSRQTGVRHRDKTPFRHDTDLDTGLIGTPESLLSVERDMWDGKVPHMSHGPMIAVPTVEEAVGLGHLVVTPPARRPLPGDMGVFQRQAAPWSTARQLARLQAKPVGDTVRFAVIGDAEPGRFWISRALFNAPGVFWRLLRRAEKSEPDFILQLGDMVSRGTLANFWTFIRGLYAAAIKTPYLTVIGNHDRHKPHGITNDRMYRAAFGSTDYVFDRGPRRFVVLDSSAGRVTEEQLVWLKGVLDPSRPTIVFTHIPPAPLGEWTDWGRFKGAGGFKQGANEFMRLMAENKVQRVYMGHIHGLGTLERDGVKYVLTGGGGSPLFPGPVKEKLHHWLSIEAGPDGVVETVHADDGSSFTLR